MEMINVKIDEINGVLVTTSNRVAEELGVEHKNLIRKIDDYVARFGSSNLSHEFYIESIFKNRGKGYRNYLITKKGIAQLIGGYSSAVERAFELNVAYINKFDEMEKIINSGKQLPIEYPATKDLEVRTFRKCHIMEIKQLCQLTGFSRESIAFNARLLKATVLKHRELMEYKNENGEGLRRVANLVILYKNEVISICKKFGIYEEMKTTIENYFKCDNRVEHKPEEEVDVLGRTYEDRINSTKRMIKMIDEKIDNKLKEIEHISKEINSYREHISFYMSQI